MLVLTKEQTEYLRELVRGTQVNRTRDWLLNVHIENSKGFGWPTSADQDYPSIWGGTLDGIRGLIASGMSLHEPLIRKSINWLLSQQRKDGGFVLDDGNIDSPGVTYSSVEATAWVLIILKSASLDILSHPQARRAISFIEKCIGPNGEIGTSDKDLDNPRIYPCLLAIWACHEYSKAIEISVQYLKDARDPISSGWGIKYGINPNPITTSQVLYVLMESGYLNRKDIVTKSAIRYIITNQHEDGSWSNFTENWSSHYQLRYPNYHAEYGTPWALLTLFKYGYSVLDPVIANGLFWLINEQKEEGYWLFDLRNGIKYIWCATDCLCTLQVARENLLNVMSDKIAKLFSVVEQTKVANNDKGFSKWSRLLLDFTRANFSNVLLPVVLLYAFRSQVNYLILQFYSFVRIRQGELLSGILSNAIYAFVFMVAAYLLNLIKQRPK